MKHFLHFNMAVLSGALSIAISATPFGLAERSTLGCTGDHVYDNFASHLDYDEETNRRRALPPFKEDNLSFSGLSKRIIDPENQRMSVDNFMRKYSRNNYEMGIRNVATLGNELWHPGDLDPGSQSAYASLQEKQSPFGLSVAVLRGCTAVVVVSDTGVWIAHIWEGIDNRPNFYREFTLYRNQSHRYGVVSSDFTPTHLGVFKLYALLFLGAPRAAFGYQVDLGSKRNDFAKPSARVFIITPQNQYPNLQAQYPMRYPKQVNALKEAIAHVTGIEMTNMHTTTYDAIIPCLRHYHAMDSNDAAGRVLYLFVSTTHKSIPDCFVLTV